MKTKYFILIIFCISATLVKAQYITAGQTGANIYCKDIIPDTTIQEIQHV